MKKLILAGCMLMGCCFTYAQCGLRYQDEIFQYSVTTVTYDVYDSLMDIYQPIGDTASVRPLIILAHGGTFIEGNKTDDSTVLFLCRNFASRGFVTASINYRLLTAIELIGDEVSGDTTAIINEVIQSLSDAKAAVRYFTKDAYTTNTYRIDTNTIFIGGNSAGAVTAMHYGYIDSLAQLTPYLQGIINSNGGLEGNSGNPGYPSKVRGVISLAGGLNDPSWVEPGSKPSFNAQGTLDSIVPYYCADAEYGEISVRLCGLGSLQPYYNSAQITESSLLFPGQGHVPWQSNAAMFYTVDSALTRFLIDDHFVTADSVCPSTAAISDIAISAGVEVYPNPASDQVNLHATFPISALGMYDARGRRVAYYSNLNTMIYQLNVEGMSKGIYYLRFETAGSVLPLVKRVVIE